MRIYQGFCAEYTNLLESVTADQRPTFGQQLIQNQLFLRGKKNGWYAAHDIFYCRLNNGSEEISVKNWIDPTVHASTLTGDVAWTSNGGLSSVISGGVRNDWDSSTDAVNYQLNDGTMWVFVKPANTSSSQALLNNTVDPVISNTQLYLDSGALCWSRYNFADTAGEHNASYAASDNFFGLRRTTAANYDILVGKTSTNKVVPSVSISGSTFNEMIIGSFGTTIPFYFSGVANGSFDKNLLIDDLTWYAQQIGVI